MVAASGGSPISKKENGDLPLFGAMARAVQCVFVDRIDPESRKKVSAEIMKRTCDPAYPPIVIFPEGTVRARRENAHTRRRDVTGERTRIHAAVMSLASAAPSHACGGTSS